MITQRHQEIDVLTDLNLHQLKVIHSGEHTFPLGKKVQAVAFSRLLDDLYPFAIRSIKTALIAL